MERAASSSPPATKLVFEVHRQGVRWLVRLGNRVYGEYLNKDEALLDAVDAAMEARQTGRETEVWDGNVQIL